MSSQRVNMLLNDEAPEDAKNEDGEEVENEEGTTMNNNKPMTIQSTATIKHRDEEDY